MSASRFQGGAEIESLEQLDRTPKALLAVADVLWIGKFKLRGKVIAVYQCPDSASAGFPRPTVRGAILSGVYR